jgi:CRP-like cAMP-binding protein
LQRAPIAILISMSYPENRALISPKRTRNATVKCITPVHAIEISREYFEKYLAASEKGLAVYMREKDKRRALKRTKNILRRQRELEPVDLKQGEFVFREGDESHDMFIVEQGEIANLLKDHLVAVTKSGEMFGVVSLITHRKRNSSASCVSKTCRVHKMKAEDFFDFMDSSPILKASVNDVFLRREFEKAVAHKTKKTFPMSREDLKVVFDSIDTHGDGYLTLGGKFPLIIHYLSIRHAFPGRTHTTPLLSYRITCVDPVHG